jgi:hypothetical protein
MGTASVMTRGTRTGHLVLIWNICLFHWPFQDQIFHSSHASQLIGQCQIHQLFKSLRRLGIPRTCTGLHRVKIQCTMRSIVYQPLCGIYGPHWQHLRRRSSPLLTRVACLLYTRMPFSCTTHLRGRRWYKRYKRGVYERASDTQR